MSFVLSAFEYGVTTVSTNNLTTRSFKQVELHSSILGESGSVVTGGSSTNTQIQDETGPSLHRHDTLTETGGHNGLAVGSGGAWLVVDNSSFQRTDWSHKYQLDRSVPGADPAHGNEADSQPAMHAIPGSAVCLERLRP